MARALRLIGEGAIGKPRMISGQSLFVGTETDDKHWSTLAESGGLLLDMGCHNFDILNALAGDTPRRIFSHVTTYAGPEHRRQNAMSQLIFANGASAQMWMSFEMPAPGIPDTAHRYIVAGERGILDIDGYGKLRLGWGDSWETVWEQPPIDYINRPFEPARLEAFYTQTQTFVDDILDRRRPAVSGEEGRAAVAMVEAAWRSSQTGQAVELSF
jgi:predicted dehydrogenase